jgi:O-antigen/teichoic acid export membrane protein
MFKNALLLTVSTSVGILTSVLQKTIVIAFLGPVGFGVYNYYMVLLGYVNYLDLGVNNGVLVKATKLKANGEIEESLRIREMAYKSIMIIAIIASLIFMIMMPGLAEYNNIPYSVALSLIFCISIPLYALINIFNVEGRLIEKYKLISMAGIIMPIVGVTYILITKAIAENNKIELSILMQVITAFAGIIIFFSGIRLSIAKNIDWNKIIDLIKIGAPITGVSILYYTFLSLDKIILAKWLNVQNYGYYTFAVTMAYATTSVANSFQVIINQKILKNSVKNNEIQKRNFIELTLMLSSLINAIIFFIALTVMPKIIILFFTQFEQSLPLIKDAFIAYMLLFPVGIIGSYLVSENFVWKSYIVLAIGISASYLIFENKLSEGKDIKILEIIKYLYFSLSLMYLIILKISLRIDLSSILTYCVPVLTVAIYNDSFFEISDYKSMVNATLITLIIIWFINLKRLFKDREKNESN